MKTRKLGRSGFEVSEVGLGCWQLGTSWGEALPEEKAFDILSVAVDQGITFFDTADVYGGGRSEKLIGQFLKANESEIKVASKYGRRSGVYPDGYTEDNLKRCVGDTLTNLQIDQLDLLQLHCIPKEELEKGAIFDQLRKLQQEGLIAHFGASVESVEEGLICIEQEGLISLQVIYNVFRQKLTSELLPQAASKSVGLIVRLPLASGLLSGKFSRETTFHDSDHRNFNRDGAHFNVGETFAGLPFEKGVELADRLKGFCPENMSMAQFTQRWILDHSEVTTIIPGASRPEQVAQNASVSSTPSLPKSLMDDLSAFYKNHVADFVRGVY